MTAHFPGGTAITHLTPYSEPAADGCTGGSPHVHLACTEGYVVVAGTGTVQTLSGAGYQEIALTPGDLVWFPPGTIHRVVTRGDLQIVVVMGNAGLPEAGDAVLTFPAAVLDDPACYAAAAALTGADGVAVAGIAAAMTRRSLAVHGFTELREAVLNDGPQALDPFYTKAIRLVADRLDDWDARVQAGPAAAVADTVRQLAALRAGDVSELRNSAPQTARPTAGEQLGMCGQLRTYPRH